jgi:DNA-binding ferritin-like protein
MNEQDFQHYHLLLDERDEQMLVRTDHIAEEARRIGGRSGPLAACQNINASTTAMKGSVAPEE